MSGTSNSTSTFHGGGRLESLPWRFLHGTHDFHRLYADRRNLPYEVDNALVVILQSVGIEFLPDRRIFGILLFVLIEDPFKGAAVPKRYSHASGGMPLRVVSLSTSMVP